MHLLLSNPFNYFIIFSILKLQFMTSTDILTKFYNLDFLLRNGDRFIVHKFF